MDLYLIRHGTTDLNLQHRYMGHLNAPLNETGREEIRRLKKHLAGLNPGFLYLSDLERCRETAALLNFPLEENETPDLREINYGIAEGRTYREMETQHPEIARAWAEDWMGFTLPGGESYLDMAGRVTTCIKQIIAGEENDCGVIISHGGCIGAALSHFLTGSFRHFWKFRVDNGSYAHLCFHAEDVFLSL